MLLRRWRFERRTLVLESDTVITGVEPGLGSDAGVALPNLHLSTVATCAGVEAVVGSRDLNGCAATVDDPVLCSTPVAVVAMERRSSAFPRLETA